MKKLMMAGLFVLGAAFAEGAPTAKKSDAKDAGAKTNEVAQLTREERIARRDKIMMERHGGLLFAKGTPAGRIVIVNAQTKVATNNFDFTALKGGYWLRGLCTIVSENVKPAACVVGEMDALRKKHDANFLLLVTDDPKLPASLVAVESQWAILNVAALEKGAATPEMTRIRARNEFTRVFCMLCGGFSSQFKAPLTNYVVTLADLDNCLADPPVDVDARLREYLDMRGVKPGRRVTYRKACQEGWAPAPTNDIQKAIWNQVHEIPTKPIKIEFEGKKGK